MSLYIQLHTPTIEQELMTRIRDQITISLNRPGAILKLTYHDSRSIVDVRQSQRGTLANW